jgi:hypothetical protein
MTLGNVGKAVSEQFSGSRKLLLVPLMTAVREDDDLRELVDRYWRECAQQVRNLELSLGAVANIYHEGSAEEGDEALASLEGRNPAAYPFLKETCERGAVLRPTDEIELLLEVVDLQRCLMQGLLSAKVAQQLSGWYRDTVKRRYEAIARRIDETLEKNQVGLLVIGQDHQVQIPQDIQVIYVAPPTLNDITRWLRDHPPGGGPASQEELQDEPPVPMAEEDGRNAPGPGQATG